MLISAVILASWVLSASGAHYHNHRHHRLEDVALTEGIDIRAQRNKVNCVFLYFRITRYLLHRLTEQNIQRWVLLLV